MQQSLKVAISALPCCVHLCPLKTKRAFFNLTGCFILIHLSSVYPPTSGLFSVPSLTSCLISVHVWIRNKISCPVSLSFHQKFEWITKVVHSSEFYTWLWLKVQDFWSTRCLLLLFTNVYCKIMADQQKIWVSLCWFKNLHFSSFGREKC